jgi:hypothetical protein
MPTTLGGLAVFGIVGIVIGSIIGALHVATWQLWGHAMAETRSADTGVVTE